ncbi:MAG: hypothetical protein KDD42_01820 [Bdellovibrionales bacterium]|nr:hypothetical protein [Bdellovibrionales bacterium]
MNAEVRQLFSVLMFLAFWVPVGASTLAADSLKREKEDVVVRVRALRGTHEGRHGLVVDERARDLEQQLNQLQFNKFKLVAAQRKVISLKGKETIPLTDGQSLTVRPMYLEPHKVGLRLKWVDRAGACILDTRMHLTPGESMLTGTDHTADSAMILAIDVKANGPDSSSKDR